MSMPEKPSSEESEREEENNPKGLFHAVSKSGPECEPAVPAIKRCDNRGGLVLICRLLSRQPDNF
jgi:hypothetical protein